MTQKIDFDDITVWSNLPPAMGGGGEGPGIYLGVHYRIDSDVLDAFQYGCQSGPGREAIFRFHLPQ
ncbi:MULTISPECIES: hypothetical protein [unclassified Halomonas]|uniref:hypothetical protein n=1 Tax=unclassified Halomonas TaxID=2609666 RepID=UPI0009907206|nr:MULTISPECIES: hypothetical protein [unclassified Halomonas]AQU83913.1 hypothetical protein B2G49_15785 [Halomonas sp. 'Soap Lake \